MRHQSGFAPPRGVFIALLAISLLVTATSVVASKYNLSLLGKAATVTNLNACGYDISLSGGGTNITAGASTTFTATVSTTNCSEASNATLSVTTPVSSGVSVGSVSCTVSNSSLNVPASGSATSTITCTPTSDAYGGFSFNIQADPPAGTAANLLSRTVNFQFGITASTTGTPKACGEGEKCPSGSWCSNGMQFYYPTNEITCVSWSNTSSDQIVAPAGTSECGPNETSCIGLNQTVDYSATSQKWCRRGMQYYSTDGTKTTCLPSTTTTTPSGYTSCRPDDKQCIPTGGYGPSTGWCTGSSRQFYQVAKDDNANNDVYCAPYSPATGTGGTWSQTEPTPPAGYSSCKPTDTYCKQIGDKWTDSSSSYWCTNGQKCSLSTGGGACVGWSESCPAGTKYCSTDSSGGSSQCVEPGETKPLTGNSQWCGRGMGFYSSTQIYCAPQPESTGSTTMPGMFTSEYIKGVLAKLGAGWGLCRPSDTQCIEPGKTGPSSGWCGWYPPMSPGGGGYSPPSTSPLAVGGTRTCPSLDGTTPTPTPVPGPEPKPVPVPEPKPIPTPETGKWVKHTWKFKDGTMESWILTRTDAAYTKYIANVDAACATLSQKGVQWKQDAGNDKPENWMNFGIPECGNVLPTPMPIPGPEPKPWPIPGPEPFPMPIPGPEPIPGPTPGPNECRMVREQVRNYKYELRGYDQQFKQLPKDVEIPGTLTDLLKSAKILTSEFEKLFTAGAKCSDTLLQTAWEKQKAIDEVMSDLRYEMQNLQGYMRCANLSQMISDRVKYLGEDIGRIKKHNKDAAEELSVVRDEMKDLLSRAKEACKTGDEFTVQDLEFEMQDLEQKIGEIFMNLQNRGRKSFIAGRIEGLRDGISETRTEITEKGLSEKEECVKVNSLFDQVNRELTEAETAYTNGDEETAAQILDKLERFKDPVMEAAKQCGVELEVDEDDSDIGDIYHGMEGISEEDIEKIVTRAVENIASKFQTALDEKITELTAKVQSLAQTLATSVQEKVTESLTALQAVAKEHRTVIEEAKNAVLETAAVIAEVKKKLKAADVRRLNDAIAIAAHVNWCGNLAVGIKEQAESLKVKAEQNDVTADDVTAFDTVVRDYEKKNNEECYDEGVTRFRDMATDAWYYPYIQNGTFFKGSGTGNVEPNRPTLRSEALIAIERTLGLPADGSCALTANAKNVPDWARCAVNIAADRGITFTYPMDQPSSRDEVAYWATKLAPDVFPASGGDKYVSEFKDIKACSDRADEVSVLVSNKIMTGRGGDQAGTWGCGQSLLRAELAAVLARLADLASLTR